MARAKGGQFLLRIEDIDQTRSRPEWETAIYRDLTWLGISWDMPPVRQSQSLNTYKEHLTTLWNRGLLYICTCSRRDILTAASAPQEGDPPPIGPDGIVYPGTCRGHADTQAPVPANVTLRLNIRKAIQYTGFEQFSFSESGSPANDQPREITVSAEHLISAVGDIVLSRKDFPGSYHLSAVADDAAAGITDVIRGEDLFEATAIHVVLQRLLGLPTPRYHHHRLIRDDDGKRLAKRDDARALERYRQDGATPNDIRRLVGLPEVG